MKRHLIAATAFAKEPFEDDARAGFHRQRTRRCLPGDRIRVGAAIVLVAGAGESGPNAEAAEPADGGGVVAFSRFIPSTIV